jgi:hypothetical protein
MIFTMVDWAHKNYLDSEDLDNKMCKVPAVWLAQWYLETQQLLGAV